ncbi:uncharacterized protein F5147DRAFT_665705 [Suillus discolor]|uniref:Uncharacterized protein n=1 Tax=Suillus discolor TaxID=1912936 RepID=A0A9P7FIX2_9AGAM|nr:uncharacterized protein F5147DRAFT_665705 [Suillus discolor]KAG2119880.1 hypothetical protein F5147DRAFT_665705 [Suillus discolor]
MAATSQGNSSLISVTSKYVAPSDPSLPALALQITSLVGSYMIWVGVTNQPPESVQNAALSGMLCKDWACAMPALPGHTGFGPATSLFRSSSSDVSFSMAQRLARRFHRQIFLSVDVPATLLSTQRGSNLLFDAEKGIVAALSSLGDEHGQEVS